MARFGHGDFPAPLDLQLSSDTAVPRGKAGPGGTDLQWPVHPSEQPADAKCN
jgi:hypothetical protein